MGKILMLSGCAGPQDKEMKRLKIEQQAYAEIPRSDGAPPPHPPTFFFFFFHFFLRDFFIFLQRQNSAVFYGLDFLRRETTTQD
jgi:hypothetical protein